MEISGSIGGGSRQHHGGSNNNNNHGNHGHHNHNHHHHHHQPIYSPPIIVPVVRNPTRTVIIEQPAHQTVIVQQPNPQRTIVIEGPPRNPHPRGSLSCWQFTIILISCLYFAFTVPMPFAERVEVMQSDRKLVHLQGNYFSAVSLDGLGPGVDAFLFEEEPRVDETVVLPARTINPVLQDGGFHAIRYDLYADSEVLVEWSFTTSRFGPSVLFLRGDEAFSMFKNGDLQDVPYSDKLHEKYHSLNGQFLLKARSRSQYYFIFYMAEPGTSSGEATFHVTAKTLNLKYPAPVASSVRDCPDKSKSCTLNLHSNGGYSHQPDYFLALVTPTTSEYGDLFSIRVGKSARVMKYVGSIFRTVLFIIVFGGFIASVWDWLKATVLVCVGVVLCGCRRLREGDYSPLRTDDEESAIGGQSQSLQQPPGPVQAQENAYPTEAPPAYTVTSDPEVLMGVDVQAVKQQNQNQPQQSVPGTSSSGRI